MAEGDSPKDDVEEPKHRQVDNLGIDSVIYLEDRVSHFTRPR